MKLPLKLLFLSLVVGLMGMGMVFQTGAAQVSAGVTETKNNQSSSSSVSAGSNARFASRRILLVATNSHPLLQRIARTLVLDLRSNSLVGEVQLQDSLAKSRFPLGTRGPDLFVVLNLAHLKERGVITREVEADVSASLGSVPWHSQHHFCLRICSTARNELNFTKELNCILPVPRRPC